MNKDNHTSEGRWPLHVGADAGRGIKPFDLSFELALGGGTEPAVNVYMKTIDSSRGPWDVASARFQPGQEPDKMVFTFHPDESDIFNVLAAKGLITPVGKSTGRLASAEPWDEHQTYTSYKADAASLYRSYVREQKKLADALPVEDIHRRHPMHPYILEDRPNFLTCRIGGIVQAPKTLMGQDMYQVRLGENVPEFSFVLKNIVGKMFQKELQAYREAQKRVTDVSVFYSRNGDEFRLRCKIDGQQQMSETITEEEKDDFCRAENPYGLVAKYYKHLLLDGQKVDMERGRSL